MNEYNENALNDDFSMKYLTFQVSGQHYGIPISNVIEIIQIQSTTQLPEMPPYSKGIINLRGDVVMLIDLNLRLGKSEKEYTDRTCVIIIDVEDLHIGLIVDAVEDVINVEDENISIPPSFSGDAPTKYVTGIAKIEKRMTLLLDVQLLADEAII